jgi:hypothetical protein
MIQIPLEIIGEKGKVVTWGKGYFAGSACVFFCLLEIEMAI